MLRSTINQLVRHVCGKDEFDEDAAFTGLEQVVDYDFQKRLVRLLGQLAEASKEKLQVTVEVEDGCVQEVYVSEPDTEEEVPFELTIDDADGTDESEFDEEEE